MSQPSAFSKSSSTTRLEPCRWSGTPRSITCRHSKQPTGRLASIARQIADASVYSSG